MRCNRFVTGPVSILALLLSASLAYGQSINAALSGTVTDPSGAVVPNAEVTLTSVATGATTTFKTGPDGLYSFPNLPRGAYELKTTAPGFQAFVQRGISLSLSESVRLDVALAVGTSVQTVEVTANASPLNFEDAELRQSVTPNEIIALPLLVNGAKRSAPNFIILMPGVNIGTSDNPFSAHINGGMGGGDESTLDGVSMQEGLLNQSGMISFGDMPIAPEAVEEVSILTANYDPQYGKTTSAVINVVTKSGSNQFHGGVYEFHRNTSLNARPFGAAARGVDLENDYGAFIGGPAKVPKVLWTGRRKTFFFVHFGGFRSIGAASKPTFTVPTDKMKAGDFSEWPYPIYDPATTQAADPNLPLSTSNVTRTQFEGCDPVNNPQPNVICATDPRMVNSLAKNWFALVPSPNHPGVTSNYEAPQGYGGDWFNADRWDMRFDHEIGSSDRITVTEHYGQIPPVFQTAFVEAITTESIRNGDHYQTPRITWDHTFSPSLLFHTGFGYLNWRTALYNYSDCCVDQVPGIAGVYSNKHQPAMRFTGDYVGYGGNDDFATDRPSYVWNGMFTWVKGKHTFRFGGEYRFFSYPETVERNGSGTFNFSDLNTGLPSIVSGNAMASFLLGVVDSASVDFRSLPKWHPQADSWDAFFGETWKATNKLSVTYGVRWDVARPAWEKDNNFSFFDPVGANPTAGGRPGRLAFAGSDWGPASFGKRYPEKTWYKGFSPRLGIAYSLSQKTVARTGYGIFIGQAYYPGWEGGISTDGFNENVAFSSSVGGLVPAFNLADGFPQNFTPPPFIDSGALNGQGLRAANNGGGNYRPFDANRLPYTQQWNFTLEHQFTSEFYISAGYVGTKGTRLGSSIIPINAINPQLLSSMGTQLSDEFQTGQTELDGVPIPYAGWIEQMTACRPTVGQALAPYPQYCGGIKGLNENAGSATYHSFQFKAEKRFSHGTSLLTSYTFAKSLTNTDNTQAFIIGSYNSISPFERERNKSLSVDDVPQVLSVAFLYELPFGQGKRFLSTGGVADKVLGGWQLSSVIRVTSGTPLYVRNGQCPLPTQVQMACTPAILQGANAFAQAKTNFEPTQPLLSRAAFETTGQLPSGDFYTGVGPRVLNIRGFGYHSHDFGLTKITKITERVKFEFRAEFFNLWNWHTFSSGGLAFTNNLASPNFGKWNGRVSAPRNVQFAGKFTF